MKTPQNEANNCDELSSSFVSPRLASERLKNAANVDVPQVCGRDMRSSGGETASKSTRVSPAADTRLHFGSPAHRLSFGSEPSCAWPRTAQTVLLFVRSRTMRSLDSARLFVVTCGLVFTSRRGACVLSNPGRDLTGAPSPHPDRAAFATRAQGGNL